MEDLNNIARQWRREAEAKALAEERLKERTARAEEKNYCSATIYGTTFIRESLNAIIARIARQIGRIAQGNAAENAAAISIVKDVDPAVLALITAKGILDCHLNQEKMIYGKVTNHIGRLIRDEIVVAQFEKECPDAYQTVLRFQHKHKGYANRLAGLRAKMRRVEHTVPRWTPSQTHLVGAFLINQLISASGWFVLGTRLQKLAKGTKNAGQTINVLMPTKEFLQARQSLLDQAQSLAVLRWPMLCEPVDWSDKDRGGYLTAEMRHHTMLVRTRAGRRCPPMLDGTPALQMLNTLQRVPYRINQAILAVANHLSENRISVGSFKRLEPEQPPTKPDKETASEEALKEYRLMRTKVEDFNASIEQKNYRTTEALFVANKYADESRFWIPWSFDFRGRVYPLVTSLSPQGTDFDKSLFLFADEGPVSAYWLAFQVATTWGLDKAPMSERQEWVANNHNLISRIANDPLDTLQEWSQAEEPWCFLAACVEYNDCVIEKLRTTSGLPVSVDATCSGLQHLSALTLDLSAAQMVNVVPTPQPTDAYALVAQKAKEFLPEAYHPLINRKVTKRTVMTTPYGVTMNSARGYIRQELPKTLEDGSPVELMLVTKAIFQQAIPAVIPGPIKAMSYIQKAALQALDNGATILKWVTPSGFVVRQDCRAFESERINTKLLGSRIRTLVPKPWDQLKIDRAAHKGASAPNLVHSFDAALLHLTFADCDRPFCLIHDCLLMRSCDMDWVNERIRQEFVQMYSRPLLQEWAHQLGVDFDPEVMINTLDINDSLHSPYLFC